MSNFVDELLVINRSKEDCITVKLLLSIDRRQGVEKAMRTIDLAVKYKASVFYVLSLLRYVRTWYTSIEMYTVGIPVGMRDKHT